MKAYALNLRVNLIFSLGAILLSSHVSPLFAADLLAVRYEGSWGAGILMEFHSDSSGNFEWRKRLNPDAKSKPDFETRTGKASLADLNGLIDRIRKAPDGTAANDVGIGYFEWLDQGQKRTRTFLYAEQPPCSELLKAVDQLAVSVGKRRQ